MRKKKQQELKKLDLTEEELKEIKKLDRLDILTDVLAFIALLIGIAIVITIGWHVYGG